MDEQVRSVTEPTESPPIPIDRHLEGFALLLQQADEQINYPFEDIIEGFLPGVDSVTDYICVGVVLIEDVYKGLGVGPLKKERLMIGLRAMWTGLPIPFFLRPFVDPMFEIGMSALIDLVVSWLNDLFADDPKKGWGDLAKQATFGA